MLCTAGPPAIQLVLVPAGMIIMPEFNSISLPTMNRKKKKNDRRKEKDDGPQLFVTFQHTQAVQHRFSGYLVGFIIYLYTVYK